jgi:hypothetical protein
MTKESGFDSLFHMSRTVLCLSGALSVGVKLPECEAEQASVCTVTKNAWKYTHILSYCILDAVLN